ncbi:hypothetical protein B0J18DRAFT_70403 [Chaetomium sp. MPI-SDFR-AT-0129]|nr:hypothetical protein B0J18DRAFT_70403 [Chaetomium sp. MPI-SDFR-AT-0129]
MVSRRGLALYDLRPTIEGQLAQLCLLSPFPSATSAVRSDLNTDADIFYRICSLFRRLTSPHPDTPPSLGAKRAFVEALFIYARALELHISTATGLAAPTFTPTPRTVLLGIMLCELCRKWTDSFPQAFPPGHAGPGLDVAALLGQGLLGQSGVGVDGLRRQSILSQPLGLPHQQQIGCLGSLAGLLNKPLVGDIRDTQTLREKLAEECGDGFCLFSTSTVRGTPMSSPGPTQGGLNARDSPSPKELGLLHCGSSNNSDDPFFLMIDFEARTLRAVDCRLAGMLPNLAEPRKLDLIVAREGSAGSGGSGSGQQEEEELFRLEAAPKHVAAFWVRYAMGDD